MTERVEEICPLCSQEMDITDQQLKPCSCGYQMCVWCWHHILQMAEKDNSDARCPACRNTYAKERILEITHISERLASPKPVRKQKVQKEKTKAPETSDDSSILRVIRRNLVYVMGLPLILADEKIMRKKEYFAQYGKIMRVVITPPPASSQNIAAPNRYCCVFVTFSKVEEALRCIQVVNGFTLLGSPLKACFGATRYCYSYLKNLPCRNANCIYVHDAASQDDICTKDEVYTLCWSKLLQYKGMGVSIPGQRSGNNLPPPVDSFSSYNNIMAAPCKSVVHSVDNNPLGHGNNEIKSGDITAVRPWSSSCTSGKRSYASVAVSNGPSKPFNDTNTSTTSFTSVAGIQAQNPWKAASQSSKDLVTSNQYIPLSYRQVENPLSCGAFDENCYSNGPGSKSDIEMKTHDSLENCSHNNGVFWENHAGVNSDVNSSCKDFIISDKGSIYSAEETIASDALSLIDLDDHQSNLHIEQKLNNGADKGNGANLLDVEKCASKIKKSFPDFSIFNSNGSDLRLNHVSEGGSNFSSLNRQSAAKPYVPPARRHLLHGIAQSQAPPGFPSRIGASSCQLGSGLYSGSSLGFGQNIVETSSSNNLDTNHAITRMEHKNLIGNNRPLHCWSSSIVPSSDVCQNSSYQNFFSFLEQSNMKNNSLQEAISNFRGLQGDSSVSSSISERTTGRSDCLRLEEITNSGRVGFSNSRFGFLIPSPKHDSNFHVLNS